MSEAYRNRYEGTRWRIAYGAYDGVERFAVNDLQREIQRRLPYVVEVLPSDAPLPRDGANLLLVGTPCGNRFLGDLASSGRLLPPEHPQGYALGALDGAFDGFGRVLAVSGASPAGVLHGVEDMCAHVLKALGGDTASSVRAALDRVGAFARVEYPRVARRGIWTWGYVIYDYRRFLDNMARLRMNSVTIWNDVPPVNAPDVVACARGRGIEVIWGFHWGWGTTLDLSRADDRRAVLDGVLEKYRRDYAPLSPEGIYFQTQTEHADTEIAGRSTASWACRLVNEVSAALFAENPSLRLYFGLHATSIRERFADLASLDPRVPIVWEDAGAVPFPYEPLESVDRAGRPFSAEETLEYSKSLIPLSADRSFAMVPKGWTSLSWPEEFEHHRGFILGERSPEWIRARLAHRQPRWDMINPAWARVFPAAARFYRRMLDAAPGGMMAWGLIEDGVFEARIQPSVALFAETLWNPFRADIDIASAASTGYYA